MKEKTFRRLIRAAELVLIVVGVLLLMQVVSNLRGNGGRRRSLTIQETQTIVTRVRAMASLVTASYYDEVVLKTTKPRTVNAFGANLALPDDELCIISRGKARAGDEFTPRHCTTPFSGTGSSPRGLSSS